MASLLSSQIRLLHAAFRAYRPESVLRARYQVTTTCTLTVRPKGQFHFPQSKVTVGPNGKVKANIEAREIVVEGIVTGDLKASANVQLGGSSRVQGSLITPRIAIDDGARLRGKVEMTRAGDAKQVEALAPISPAATVTTNEAPRAIAHASGE